MEKTERTNKDIATDLADLFEDGLKDIYWAEKEILKELPKMNSAATSLKLKKVIERHEKETEEQIDLLEQVFKEIKVDLKANKCEAMAGILKEGKSILEHTASGSVRDAGIIAACQKVEHYEIASYGTLIAYSILLEYKAATKILQKILDQERETDEALTKLAISEVNIKADR